MGEAPKLDQDEAIGFVARCVARAPKLPFIVGVSAPGFAAMRALSHAAMAKGAAGVMIAPPPPLRTDGRCHVWTPLADQGLFLALRRSWVRSCLRPSFAENRIRWP
jgi:hypothetical protein